MIKTKLNPIYILAIVAILLSVGGMFLPYKQQATSTDDVVGASFPDSQWVNINSFSGYQTDVDETKLPDGANGRGQNTTANDGDRISIRNNGIVLFPSGTASSSEDSIKTLHTFRKKDGESIILRTFSTLVEYFEETGDAWTILKGGYTDGQVFGFADYNKTTDITSYTYFGNGIEEFSRWTGVHTTLSATATSGANTIFVVDAGDFSDTGTVVVCGTEYDYTGKDDTYFTIDGTLSAACASGTGIPEAVEVDATNPRGNIYIAFDNRLLISGIASTSQAVYFSKYGDPMDYLTPGLVSASTDADADIFNLVEGGGAVTGMAMDESSLYIFKRSIIYKVSLTDTDYNVTQLKPFDGKSQTTGLTAQGGVFSGGNGVFFITPDNQIMALERVENVDFPQIVPISEKISNTVDSLDFSTASGIVFQDTAYFSCRSSVDATFNDTVLVWNIRDKTWDSPIVGWNVSNFTVYGNSELENLYLADSISPNVFVFDDEILDNNYSIKSSWRSKQFDFGVPERMKNITNFYVEGYISQNTTLNISLLLDENGDTQTFSTDFAGTETDYLFDTESYNSFGLTPFGSERFGSQAVSTTLKKFRFYLNKDFRASPFYNAQVEFASEGENYNWEVTNFGFYVREHTQPLKQSLFRSFQ